MTPLKLYFGAGVDFSATADDAKSFLGGAVRAGRGDGDEEDLSRGDGDQHWSSSAAIIRTEGEAEGERLDLFFLFVGAFF